MADSDLGAFIWYELMTSDPRGAKAFYDSVVGWDIDAENSVPDGSMDYRMIKRSDGGFAGGVMAMTEEMAAGGAKPGWFGYVHVPDVDAAVKQFTDAGGQVFMPATDMDGVGRMAFLADPQGASLYVMTPTPPPGNPDAKSDVFAETVPQRCGWNELGTKDDEAALSFYTGVFGWNRPEPMDMGDMGKYHFIAHGDERIGAVHRLMPGQTQSMWRYYFRVPSITDAIAAVEAGGGKVDLGPHEVPDGDHIILGTDPQSASFALVGGK